MKLTCFYSLSIVKKPGFPIVGGAWGSTPPPPMQPNFVDSPPHVMGCPPLGTPSLLHIKVCSPLYLSDPPSLDYPFLRHSMHRGINLQLENLKNYL